MTNRDGSIEFLSEVLDKLIETQVQNAQATSDLKHAVEDNNKHLAELQRQIAEVNGHFSNGFRTELKEHMTKELEERASVANEKSEKILKTINNFTSAIQSPKSWISAFLFIATLFGSIAAIVTYAIKLTGGP